MIDNQTMSDILSEKESEFLRLKEGSDSYGSKRIKKETFKKVREITKKILNLCINDNLERTIPDLFPGSEGEIEMDWENSMFTLIIIVPEASNIIIFLCISKKSNRFKGITSIEKVDNLYLSCINKCK